MNIYGIIFAGLIGLIGGGGAAVAIMKATNRPCPACNCPPATEINMQQFDPGKIINRKGTFTYAPQIELHNVTLKLDCQDTLIVPKIKQAGN